MTKLYDFIVEKYSNTTNCCIFFSTLMFQRFSCDRYLLYARMVEKMIFLRKNTEIKHFGGVDGKMMKI